MADRLPAIAEQLIAGIPQMEGVRARFYAMRTSISMALATRQTSSAPSESRGARAH